MGFSHGRGVSTVKKENGVDTFWYETWVPGIFEMVVNNKELVRKYPQIAKAFDDYGHLKKIQLLPEMYQSEKVLCVLFRLNQLSMVRRDELHQKRFQDILEKQDFFQFQIVLVERQEKKWEKGVVILKKKCAFS